MYRCARRKRFKKNTEIDLMCEEKSLGQTQRASTVIACGEDEKFSHDGKFCHDKKTIEFPLRFFLKNGTEYNATRFSFSGAKGVVRMYSTSNGDSMMVKAYFYNSETKLEKEVSRLTRDISGIIKTSTVSGKPYLFGEWVDLTLRDVFETHIDTLRALREVSRLLRDLNKNLASCGAVYLDVTSSNVGMKRTSQKWIMMDLGAVYVKGWGSEIVTPSFVPPFMWKRNLHSCSADRFEIHAKAYTPQELCLVSAYGVLVTFVALAIDREKKHDCSIVYFLHSEIMRKHLKDNKDVAGSLKTFLEFFFNELEQTSLVQALIEPLSVFLNVNATVTEMQEAFDGMITKN